MRENRAKLSLLISPLISFFFVAMAPATRPPQTGPANAAFRPLDEAIQRFMETINSSAATAAVSRGGKLLYARGYGWRDARRQKPTQPDTLMRIASVTKPITATAVRKLAKEGKLSLQTRVFPLLGIRPYNGKVGDPRLERITVGHLLAHKGGWDSKKTFDPMFRTSLIEKALGLRRPATPVNVIEYMLAQSLQFDPEEREAYSNFGYCVLGRVLEKVAAKPYMEVLQQEIFDPLGVTDIKPARSAAKDRDPREVWYPVPDNEFSVDVMDSHGGLIASAPALCQFLAHYWISGEPRRRGGRFEYTSSGSFPGTTALAYQRADGIDVVVLLNNRRDRHYAEDDQQLIKSVDEALDRIIAGD
jgi:N-acyl-D-amino-acid deacylase